MVTEASTSDVAEQRLLGGISSAFRTNPFTGRHLVVQDAHGARLRTTDGRSYIDMFMAHGSTVLGHAHPVVLEAVRESLDAGVVIGYETDRGESVARQLSVLLPSAEAVRFVASGSEAVATALRVARAHTGRDLVVKIDGHFNGGADYAMVNSLAQNIDLQNEGGSVSRRIPSSAGMPRSVLDSVLPIPWNDLDALDAVLTAYPDQIAAVIMVPIDYNNGCIAPSEGYLQASLERTHAAGALVIFDEVLSGLKVEGGSAQAMYGVTPDLTTVSKAISSGVPLAGVVGRRAYMESMLLPAPDGPVQGGTFAGSALGLAAASVTLSLLTEGSLHSELLKRAGGFFGELQAIFDRSPLPARVQGIGCMFSIYLGTRDPVRSCRDVNALDRDLARRFFSRCIDEGVYFHTDFSVSAAHDPALLEEVLERIELVANETRP